MVPQKTSTSPNPSNTTVNFSDVKNRTSRSSMSIFHGLNKFRERAFLSFDDLCVAHKFVEPGLAGLGHHRADQLRRLAAAGVRAAHLDDGGFAARGFDRLGRLGELIVRKVA